MSDFNFDDLITEITLNSGEHCSVCFRLGTDRKLIRPIALTNFMKIANIPKFTRDNLVCHICERQAVKAIELVRTVSASREFSSLLTNLSKKQYKREQLLQILPVHLSINNKKKVCPEELVKSLRRISHLATTDVLVVTTNSEDTDPFYVLGNEKQKTVLPDTIVLDDDGEEEKAELKLVPQEKLLEPCVPCVLQNSNLIFLNNVPQLATKLIPPIISILENNIVTLDARPNNVAESIVNDNKAMDTIKPYKYCIVPSCTSSTVNTPNKIFFCMPRNPKIRKIWCKTIRRGQVAPLKKLYCCASHFDIEVDTTNYIEYNVMKRQGINIELKLKEGVVPHKFLREKTHVPEREGMCASKREDVKEDFKAEFENIDPLELNQTQEVSDPFANVRLEVASGAEQDNNICIIQNPVSLSEKTERKDEGGGKDSTDWEDKIPMDVISFMNARDPNVDELLEGMTCVTQPKKRKKEEDVINLC